MKGTTLECFGDLMKRLHALPDFYEKRKQLAELLGVGDSTIQRWTTGVVAPLGMSLISLRCHLDFLGYNVEEFSALTPEMQEASKLLAFRVISLDDMTKLLEFGEYTDQVLAVLRGVRGISKEREKKFAHMVGAYRDELTKARAALPRLVELEERLVQDEVETARSAQAQSVAPLATPMISDSMREGHFKCLTLMLLDHARYYTGPELPDEVREHLRSIVGQRNIFELKNLLVRLCGNTAFKQTQP
jgi:hypothetical protein